MLKGREKIILFFSLIFLLVFVDILTKWLVVLFFSKKIVIIPHLIEIVLHFNNGGVFGFGSSVLYGRLLLIFTRFLILALMIINNNRILEQKNIFYQLSFVFSCAGCIGNLIDILFYWKKTVGFDGVIDWIKLPFFEYIFNFADVYISIALFLMIIGMFKTSK